MNTFFLLALSLLIIILPCYLFRAIKGPNLFDRLIGLNGIASKSIIFLALLGAMTGQLDMFLDICLGYAALNLVGALAVGKFLEKRKPS